MAKTRKYDVADHLRTPKEMALYLDACIEESDGDAAFIAKALGDIARAQGMAHVARAAGLKIDDIADDLPIQTVSTGNAFAIVPVKSLAVLQNLSPTWAVMKTYLEKTEAKFLYFVSRETLNPEAKLQARMIFYNGEDPATGYAAGPCVAWAVQYGVIPADEQVLLEQGVEMQRRSRIFFSASRKGDKILNVRVGGHAVEVMRGELFL